MRKKKPSAEFQVTKVGSDLNAHQGGSMPHIGKHSADSDNRSCYELAFSPAIFPTAQRVSQQLEQHESDIRDAVRAFLNDIDSAFTGTPKQDQNLQCLRKQYVTSLAAVYRFLSRLDWKHAARFVTLGDAISDLNLGVQWPLLMASKDKVQLIPSRIHRARAHVVFALDVLIDAIGMTPKKAAKDILGEFPDIKYLAQPKSLRGPFIVDLQGTILGWRKGLSAPRRRKDKIAEGIIKRGRALIEEYRDIWSDAQFREIARESLRQTVEVGVFLAHSNTL
jgi:hypothetical protein